jgi:hypothetical protein
MQLSREEFMTFILLYAAYADDVVKAGEINYIKSKTTDELMKKIEPILAERNQVKNFQILLRHKENYFPHEDGSRRLLEEMENVFLSDDEYHPTEKRLFESVRNIFHGISQ